MRAVGTAAGGVLIAVPPPARRCRDLPGGPCAPVGLGEELGERVRPSLFSTISLCAVHTKYSAENHRKCLVAAVKAAEAAGKLTWGRAKSRGSRMQTKCGAYPRCQGRQPGICFQCFFQCHFFQFPSSQPPRQVKGEGMNTCRGIALCSRRGCQYAASARCGKALNGAFRWRGCDILLHTVVLHFLSVLIPVLFQSQAISACWRA